MDSEKERIVVLETKFNNLDERLDRVEMKIDKMSDCVSDIKVAISSQKEGMIWAKKLLFVVLGIVVGGGSFLAGAKAFEKNIPPETKVENVAYPQNSPSDLPTQK